MIDLNDFETELRATLIEVEAAATPPAGLAARLVDNVSSGRGSTVHRVDFRRSRWLPPLLAAAAVIALVVGGAAVLTTTRAEHRSPATDVPTPVTSAPTTPEPSPTPSDNAIPTGTTLPSGFVAVAASFRDAADGYAIGNVPCSSAPGYCATLARTTDGGTTWRQIPLPGGLTPVDDKGNESGGSCGTNGTMYGPCVDKVVFADALHGFVYSFHQLYSTKDGGRTWHDEHALVSHLVVVGDAVVRIGPRSACSSGCEVQIYRATLGSSKWAESEPPGGVGILGSQLVVSGTSVYLQANRVAQVGGDITSALYRSTDGGTSWQAASGNTCNDTIVPAPNDTITCTTSDAARSMQTVGAISYRLGADGTSVDISVDGGQNFTPHAF